MGTPPDAFTVTGQNWEFPCYKWDNHIQEDFAWWRRRLRKMAEYYDLFRIDHVLGFFRIWVVCTYLHLPLVKVICAAVFRVFFSLKYTSY